MGHLQRAASGHLLKHPTSGHLANGCMRTCRVTVTGSLCGYSINGVSYTVDGSYTFPCPSVIVVTFPAMCPGCYVLTSTNPVVINCEWPCGEYTVTPTYEYTATDLCADLRHWTMIDGLTLSCKTATDVPLWLGGLGDCGDDWGCPAGDPLSCVWRGLGCVQSARWQPCNLVGNASRIWGDEYVWYGEGKAGYQKRVYTLDLSPVVDGVMTSLYTTYVVRKRGWCSFDCDTGEITWTITEDVIITMVESLEWWNCRIGVIGWCTADSKILIYETENHAAGATGFTLGGWSETIPTLAECVCP